MATKKEVIRREALLRQLQEKGNSKVILAPKGFGKSFLISQLKDTSKVISLDLKKISLSPENFAQEFILKVLGRDGSLSSLKSHTPKNCSQLISVVENELEKIKPDQNLVLNQAFSLPKCLASDENQKVILAVENFDLISRFGNFGQVKDPYDIFFNSAPGDNCRIVLLSTASTEMKKTLDKFPVDFIELPAFSQEEISGIFAAVCGKTDSRVIEEVFKLTHGFPAIVTEIARRYKEIKSSDIKSNVESINYILDSELSNKYSKSYITIYQLFHEALDRARGESLLKAVLKALSRNPPLRLSELARKVYRPAPVAKALLDRLMDVDLVKRDGNLFDVSNPVLKQWLLLYFSGIEFDHAPTDAELKEVAR